MESARCVKCSSGDSVQGPCRVCGIPVCFTCVLKKVALWERETFKRTSNWWCGSCSKANKENVTPNVPQEAEDDEKCKICGNRQPVCRVCPGCENAALYFCVGDDCWKIDTTGKPWICCQCLHKDTYHNSSSNKYAVPIGDDGTVKPELFLDVASADKVKTSSSNNETLREDSPSPNLETWVCVEHSVDRLKLSDDVILSMRMENVEKTKEVKNIISVEEVDQILANMKEDHFQDNTFLKLERGEVENGHVPLDDNNKVQLEFIEELEEISSEIRVVLDNVLERSLYSQMKRNQSEQVEKKSEEVEQAKDNVDKSDVEAVQQSKRATKREDFSGKTDEHTTKHQTKHEDNRRKEENSAKINQEQREEQATEAANPLEALLSTEIGETTRNALKGLMLLGQVVDPPIPKEKTVSFKEITEGKPLESTEQDMNRLTAKMEAKRGQPSTSQSKKAEMKKVDTTTLLPRNDEARLGAEAADTQTVRSAVEDAHFRGGREENRLQRIEDICRIVEASNRQMARTTMENAFEIADTAVTNFKRLRNYWEDLCKK